MSEALKSTEEHKTIIRRFSEEILTEKRLDVVDQLVARDYVDHAALPGQAPGLEGAKQKWAMWLAAVPDLRTTIEELVAEENTVAARWTAEGTHQGELLGIPPTGQRFRFSGISIFRIRDGRIVEQREEWDRLSLLQQLGAIPARAASAAEASSSHPVQAGAVPTSHTDAGSV
jgi:steroid delta-isomerase-like uncharacterized protein